MNQSENTMDQSENTMNQSDNTMNQSENTMNQNESDNTMNNESFTTSDETHNNLDNNLDNDMDNDMDYNLGDSLDTRFNEDDMDWILEDDIDWIVEESKLHRYFHEKWTKRFYEMLLSQNLLLIPITKEKVPAFFMSNDINSERHANLSSFEANPIIKSIEDVRYWMKNNYYVAVDLRNPNLFVLDFPEKKEALLMMEKSEKNRYLCKCVVQTPRGVTFYYNKPPFLNDYEKILCLGWKDTSRRKCPYFILPFHSEDCLLLTFDQELEGCHDPYHFIFHPRQKQTAWGYGEYKKILCNMKDLLKYAFHLKKFCEEKKNFIRYYSKNRNYKKLMKKISPLCQMCFAKFEQILNDIHQLGKLLNDDPDGSDFLRINQEIIQIVLNKKAILEEIVRLLDFFLKEDIEDKNVAHRYFLEPHIEQASLLRNIPKLIDKEGWELEDFIKLSFFRLDSKI